MHSAGVSSSFTKASETLFHLSAMTIVRASSRGQSVSDDEKPGADAMIETAETGSAPLDYDVAPPRKLTPEEERKLYRKIDLRLIPIMWLMYLGSQLDRSMLQTPSTIYTH
jgi:hypothetical protein